MKLNYYLNKIKSFLVLDYKILQVYGVKTASYDFLKNFVFRSNKGLGKKIYYNKYENIKHLLLIKYKDVLYKYYNLNSDECYDKASFINKNSNIWFLWWQGVDENTPELVQECLNSVKKNKGQHNVIVITKYNIRDYLDLPEYYFDKLDKKIITLTHFSDIIRIELLSKYGGIWSDASFFWNEPIPEYVYDLKFYTLKHGLFSDFHVCKGLWTDGFIASGQNNLMMLYLRDAFRAYWKCEDFLLCYLLIDSFIALGYENWKFFNECINIIPYSNREMYFIDLYGNDKFDSKIYFDKISTTHIFRVHYKKLFYERTKDNEITNFGYIVRSLNEKE